MTNELIAEIEKIINENQELKEKVTQLEINNRNLSMRERLYQSELQNVKNTLVKMSQSIQLTPHSKDIEYREVVYGGNEQYEGR
jgi:predicted RNA-binding protein with RPS1 domain